MGNDDETLTADQKRFLEKYLIDTPLSADAVESSIAWSDCKAAAEEWAMHVEQSHQSMDAIKHEIREAFEEFPELSQEVEMHIKNLSVFDVALRDDYSSHFVQPPEAYARSDRQSIGKQLIPGTIKRISFFEKHPLAAILDDHKIPGCHP